MPVSSCLLLLNRWSTLREELSILSEAWHFSRSVAARAPPCLLFTWSCVFWTTHSHHDQWLTLTQLLHPARLILVKLLHWRFGPLVEMRTSNLSDPELWPPFLWELKGLLLAAWCPASWDDFVTFEGGSFKTANEGWWQFVIQINPQILTMHDTMLADSPKFIRFSSEGEGTDAGLNCIFLFQVVVCEVTVLLWLWKPFALCWAEGTLVWVDTLCCFPARLSFWLYATPLLLIG